MTHTHAPMWLTAALVPICIARAAALAVRDTVKSWRKS